MHRQNLGLLLVRHLSGSKNDTTPINLQPFGRQFISNIFRGYSTEVTDPDHPHNFEVLHDKFWPIQSGNKVPHPYQLFDIKNPNDINKSLLKQKYHFYVKLYHPDNNGRFKVATHNCATSSFLSEEEKLKRFKIISNAYTLLKDNKVISPSTIGGNGFNGSTRSYNPAYYNAYHNAGTWNEMEDWARMNPQYKEEFNIWTFCSCMLGLIVCIKGLEFLTELETTINNTDLSSSQDTIEGNLISAYTNYGLETDKTSRLKRFLWFRTYNYYLNKKISVTKEQFQSEMQSNDRLLKEMDEKKKDQKLQTGIAIPK